jgi:precorrin-6B methylase 2
MNLKVNIFIFCCIDLIMLNNTFFCSGNIEILKSTVEPLRQMLKTFDVSSVEGGENMKESLETYYHVLMK